MRVRAGLSGWGLIIETPMVRDGFFYALGLGAVTVVLWKLTHMYSLCAIPVLLAVFFLWFFRDPARADSGWARAGGFSGRWGGDGGGVD